MKWNGLAQRYGLRAWAGLALRAGLALLILELGARGLLAFKRYLDRDLPVCYDYVTVRCRAPDYNTELERVVQFDLLVGASHVPGYRGELINTNRLGFRGAREVGPKSAETLRVAVVGGSAAWGSFVNDHESMPAYLETALAAELGRPVEVVNAAVTSATSFQELVHLQADVMPLDPDVVVVFDGRNDLYYGFSPRWDARRTPAIQGYEAFVRRSAEAEPRAVVELAWRSSLRYSAFLNTVDLVSQAVNARRQATEPLAFQSEALDAYARNLRWMAAVLSAEGVTPVFVLQPILQAGAKPLSPEEEIVVSRLGPAQISVQDHYPQASEAVLALSQTHPEVVALDYRQVFADTPERVYFDEVHYTAEGNRIIAERLARDLAAALTGN
jgi:lysophospholipase L1-like esterase